MKTRDRILECALTLFNQQGEPIVSILEIANELAKGKGVGIAERLMENEAITSKDKAEKAEMNRSGRLHMATQLISEHQLQALDKLLPGDTSDKATTTTI